MPRTNETAYLIWSLTASGQGTDITTSGNSGSYTATDQNARTAVDLRWTDDVWLSAVATGGTGTSATVQLDGYDDQGNLFAQLLKVTLASAPGSAVAFAGRHGGSSASYVVLPSWGRISWALTGTMSGCEICLFGR